MWEQEWLRSGDLSDPKGYIVCVWMWTLKLASGWWWSQICESECMACTLGICQWRQWRTSTSGEEGIRCKIRLLLMTASTKYMKDVWRQVISQAVSEVRLRRSENYFTASSCSLRFNLGPMRTMSQGGARFVVAFLINHAMWPPTTFVSVKSVVVDEFIEYKSMLKRTVEYQDQMYLHRQ